jgi:hypothetical protein
MANLSISKAWDEARDVLARDGKLISSVALALLVLPETVSGLIGPSPALSGVAQPSWMPAVALIVGLLGIVGQLAIARLALGPSTSVGEAITHGARRLVPAFAALFLLAAALAVIFVPLALAMGGPAGIESLTTDQPAPGALRALVIVIVVALFLAPKFQLVVPTAAAERGGPIHLLRRSWQLTDGSYWRMLGFLALVFLVAIVLVLFVGQVMVGILAKTLFGTLHPFSIGALVAALLTALVSAVFAAVVATILARIYVQLAGRSRASVPSSGT